MDPVVVARELNIRDRRLLLSAVERLGLGAALRRLALLEFIEPASTRLSDRYILGVTTSEPFTLVVSRCLRACADDCVKVSGLVHELGHVRYFTDRQELDSRLRPYLVSIGTDLLDISELVATAYEEGFYRLFPACIHAKYHWLEVMRDSLSQHRGGRSPEALYRLASAVFKLLSRCRTAEAAGGGRL